MASNVVLSCDLCGERSDVRPYGGIQPGRPTIFRVEVRLAHTGVSIRPFVHYLHAGKPDDNPASTNGCISLDVCTPCMLKPLFRQIGLSPGSVPQQETEDPAPLAVAAKPSLTLLRLTGWKRVVGTDTWVHQAHGGPYGTISALRYTTGGG